MPAFERRIVAAEFPGGPEVTYYLDCEHFVTMVVLWPAYTMQCPVCLMEWIRRQTLDHEENPTTVPPPPATH